MPEVWLRGPIAGVPDILMPAAHALVGALEDLRRVAADLSDDELNATPGGAASVGFHLRHVAGSTDRLFTYARGEALDDRQRELLTAEAGPPPDRATLLKTLDEVVRDALDQLRGTSPDDVLEPRKVGRAGLPSTVLGLLFHAAEHAQRHTGQAIATAKAVRAGCP